MPQGTLRAAIETRLILRKLGIVLLGLGDREVHLRPECPALEPGAGRENFVGSALVLSDEPAHVTESEPASEEPERLLAEMKVLASARRSGIRQCRESRN